jgi:deoxyribodipyrimidine photolyase
MKSLPEMKKPSLSIAFFSWNSLRIQDQPLLFQSLGAEFLLPVSLTKPLLKPTTWRHSIPRFSNLQKSFLIDSLMDLQENLRGKNSDLFLLKGADQIATLVEELDKHFEIIGMVI